MSSPAMRSNSSPQDVAKIPCPGRKRELALVGLAVGDEFADRLHGKELGTNMKTKKLQRKATGAKSPIGS